MIRVIWTQARIEGTKRLLQSFFKTSCGSIAGRARRYTIRSDVSKNVDDDHGDDDKSSM